MLSIETDIIEKFLKSFKRKFNVVNVETAKIANCDLQEKKYFEFLLSYKNELLHFDGFIPHD